jgi:chromosome segregation ATPase
MLTTKALFSKAEGLDERSLDFLAQAIEKSNLPGFDYYEFKRAVATLESMQLDPATAHKSAFATAATVGVTKEKLLETAGFYINLLVKEKDTFDAALQNQNDSKITSRQTEIQRLRDQIERNKAEITRLQDQMAGYLTEIDQSEASLKLDTEKLAKTKSAFDFTQQAMVLQIENDVELMHKYL